MKIFCLLAAVLIAGLLGSTLGDATRLAAASPTAAGATARTAVAHVRNTFEFTVRAPQRLVAPLFGAHRERAWAQGWNPEFLYPLPPEDKPGVVFQVTHEGRTSTWITTVFEPETGHIQHVYFVPGAMTALIDIRLVPTSPAETRVQVAYERTALAPDYNAHVEHLGESDAKSGPHWQAAIDDYFRKTAAERKDSPQ